MCSPRRESWRTRRRSASSLSPGGKSCPLPSASSTLRPRTRDLPLPRCAPHHDGRGRPLHLGRSRTRHDARAALVPEKAASTRSHQQSPVSSSSRPFTGYTVRDDGTFSEDVRKRPVQAVPLIGIENVRRPAHQGFDTRVIVSMSKISRGHFVKASCETRHQSGQSVPRSSSAVTSVSQSHPFCRARLSPRSLLSRLLGYRRCRDHRREQAFGKADSSQPHLTRGRCGCQKRKSSNWARGESGVVARSQARRVKDVWSTNGERQCPAGT